MLRPSRDSSVAPSYHPSAEVSPADFTNKHSALASELSISPVTAKALWQYSPASSQLPNATAIPARRRNEYQYQSAFGK